MEVVINDNDNTLCDSEEKSVIASEQSIVHPIIGADVEKLDVHINSKMEKIDRVNCVIIPLSIKVT